MTDERERYIRSFAADCTVEGHHEFEYGLMASELMAEVDRLRAELKQATDDAREDAEELDRITEYGQRIVRTMHSIYEVLDLVPQLRAENARLREDTAQRCVEMALERRYAYTVVDDICREFGLEAK